MTNPESRATFKGGNMSIDPPRSANSPTASATVIWLDALVRSLDLPLQERQQIRLELQSHIDDRVRDLILEGTDEGEATRRALTECGEASSLASGFSEVKKALRRRTLMNIGVVGAACGLVALGLGTFRNANSEVCPPEELAAMQRAQAIAAATEAQAAAAVAGKAMRAYAAQASYSLALRPSLADAGPSVEFNEEHLENILKIIAGEAGQPVQINWTALSAGGVERNTQISIKMPIKDPFAAIEFLNEVIGDNPESGPGPIAIRQRSDSLEIVSTSWLDKREAKLVIYDISAPVENNVSAEELVQAITQFIEPSNWRENGGDRAEMNVVGDRLLVKAPTRMHEGVKWMIDQFDGQESHTDALAPALDHFFTAPRRPGELRLVPTLTTTPDPAINEAQAPAPLAPEVPSSDAKPVVLNLHLQHTDAARMSELLQSLTCRSENPLNVQIASDESANRLVFEGADALRCQQIAGVIDSAMGGSPVITKSNVPVLGSLPLLNSFFSGKTASLSVSNQVEIATPKPGDR